MFIRHAEPRDGPEIVRLYQLSQAATGLPDPAYLPPDKLGEYLDSRDAITRYVAIEANKIVGHGLIERPNPLNVPTWKRALTQQDSTLIEFGGDFVDPNLSRRGIWTALLLHRIHEIRETHQAVPVAVTWQQNRHVVRTFERYGGTCVGQRTTPGGEVSLFVFE